MGIVIADTRAVSRYGIGGIGPIPTRGDVSFVIPDGKAHLPQDAYRSRRKMHAIALLHLGEKRVQIVLRNDRRLRDGLSVFIQYRIARRIEDFFRRHLRL